MRAQTSLPALGIALVVLVSTALFAMTVAQEQLRTAPGETLEREAATSLSEALVAPDATVTRRANVVDPGLLRSLTVADLEQRYGLESSAGVRVQLDGRTLLERGDVSDGSTVDRIVLLESRSPRTIVPAFSASRNVTLPRRTRNVTLDIRPGPNATVERVRANGRVRLESPGGLRGRATVGVSRYETVTLRFEGAGTLSRGDVRVTYYPARTRRATVSVTVLQWGDP